MPAFDRKKADRLESWYHTDKGREHLRLQTNLIRRLLNPRPGERLLDVGCGSGIHLQFFRREGLDVTGVDPSNYMLDLARQRMGNRADLFPGKGEDLPFEDNEFEIVTLINCLEFAENPHAVIEEAVRVARDRVFIGALNSLSLTALSLKARSIIRGGAFKDARMFSLWELSSMLRDTAGSANIEWASLGLLPLSISERVANFEASPMVQKNPFGLFLGITARVSYLFRTDNLELKPGLVMKGKPAATPTASVSGFNLKSHAYEPSEARKEIHV